MIHEIPISTIQNLKKDFLSKKIHEKRMKNKLYLEEYETDNPILVSNELEYYQGIFNIPIGNPFFFDIIIDKFPDIDISDTNKCIKILSNKRGKKIQRGRFRDLYIKPINKWLRNRSIMNKQFAELLLAAKLNGSFDELVEFLDSDEKYTIGRIKYFYLRR